MKIRDIEDLADEIIAGKWGNGEERKRNLQFSGLNYHIVQDYVNKKLKGTLTDDDYVNATYHMETTMPDQPINLKNRLNATKWDYLLPNASTTTPEVELAPRVRQREDPEPISAGSAALGAMNRFFDALREAFAKQNPQPPKKA